MLNYTVKPKNILIVDDEATLLFFLRQALQDGQQEFMVDVAPTGEDAITKLTYNHYDLLITDFKMPGISGFTLVDVARSLQSDIKIILMTAFGSPETVAKIKQLQVDAYLTKPFPTSQLRELTKNFLTPDNLMEKPAAN